MQFSLADWFPVLLSLRVACIAVFIVTIVGIPISRLMSRRDFPGKDLLEAFFTLPLVLPPSVIGYGLLILIGNRGLLGKSLAGMGISILFTWWAVVMAATVVSFPLMYQSAKAAFKSIDVNFEKAARTLGASETRIFFTISLPLAWPGLVAGLILAFARAMGEFGATLMIAGNIPGQTQTIPLAIYFAVESGDDPTAKTLVAIVTLFCFLLIFWVNRWNRRRNY